MKNKNIIKWFELLIKQLEYYVDIKTGNDKLIYSYKLNTNRKVLDTIKKLDFTIKSGNDLKDYKGIGKGTIKRIDEILQTNKLSEVDNSIISGKHLEYIENLIKVFGIGRKKAFELYTKHNIKNINDLKKSVKNKKINLPENILKGIKFIDKIKTNIPRKEMDKINVYLVNHAIEFNKNLDIRLCGSYRREKNTSNDIDVIISHPKIITKKQSENSDLLKKYIESLTKNGFIVESLTSSDVPTKYMGLCRLSSKHNIRRIDIRFIPQESYYTALLYFTGSANFNQQIRRVAISMGYKLNEYYLLNNNNKPFKIKSEKHIFDLLNMEYVLPNERN